MSLSPSHRPLSPILLAVPFAAALGSGCGEPSPDPSARAIAELAGRPIPLAEFQPLLDRHLQAPADDASDAVKSRLLDEFLDQRLLLEEAHRRGIRADDLEVERALAGLPEEDGPADGTYREQVRATLTVEKLLRLSLQESTMTPEEAQAFYDRHREDFRRPAVVKVRQILLEDADVAAETLRLLQDLPESFPLVASERSLSPDRGRELSYSVDDLPEEVAGVIVGLQEGQLSPVIPMADSFLIVRIEESRDARDLSLEEALPEIRARLLEEKGTGAVSRLLADLRLRLGLRVLSENLPFEYVKEEA